MGLDEIFYGTDMYIYAYIYEVQNVPLVIWHAYSKMLERFFMVINDELLMFTYLLAYDFEYDE